MDAPAIRCRGLVKIYPPDVRAVDGLDLEIHQGECFGLLGPNGAGKTTTVEICEGLLEPTGGEVEILGCTWRNHEKELRRRIGISLQETQLPDKSSVFETVTLFRSFYPSGIDPEQAIRLVDLEHKRDAWVGKLSGGQKKRLEIACAVSGQPELLFLDEPTTGLDPQARRQLWELIRLLRAEGRTVLLTTHYLDEAEKLCDRVAIIDRGRVIAIGAPVELIASLGGEHVIEFTDDEDVAQAEWLRSLPSVTEAQTENGRYCLTVERPHEALPALLEALQARGRTLRSLRTRHVSLEDVFLRLTGRRFEGEEELAA